MRKVAAIALILTVVPLAIAVAQPHIQGGGSRGVPLQTTSPGTFATGHVNIKGNIISSQTQPPQAAVWASNALYSNGGGLFLSGTPNVGAAITGGWGSYLDIFPSAFNANVSGGNVLFRLYSVKNSSAAFDWNYDTADTGASTGVGSSCSSGVGCINTTYSACGNGVPGFGAPCITTSSGRGISSPLYIGGQVSSNNANNKVVVTTGITLTAGTIFEVVNHGVLQASFGYDGTLTTATPIPVTSGGTGTATALNCPYIGSNGAAFSCSASPSGILGSGRVAGNGVITAQAGIAVTSAKGSTGNYTITVPGMTINGVVMVTPLIGAAGAGRMSAATAAAGNFAVYIKSGADGATDDAFQYAIISL